MTKQESLELQELGLTEAQIEQRAQEISTKLREASVPSEGRIAAIEESLKPTRKRRSDAGKPKAKKAEAVPGVLTSLELSKLESAIDMLMVVDRRIADFERERDVHKAFIKKTLDSLKGTA